MRTPDRVIAPAAAAFLAVVAEHPGDVRHGQAQLVDLAAVLQGEHAPSLARKATVRRGRVRQLPPMSLAQAASNVMGYVDPVVGSAVHRALNEFRETVLHWVPPGNVPLRMHSAPPPRHDRPPT